MKNVDMRIDKKTRTLTITVDLATDCGESKSGKSIIIASTEGNVELQRELEGEFEEELVGVFVGLNVYRKKYEWL